MKKQIGEKAFALFSEHGFKKTTMDDLALALGISKKTIYQHFTSKEQVIDSCVKELNQSVLEELSQHKAQQGTCVKEVLEIAQQLERIIQFSFLPYAEEYSAFYKKVEHKQQGFLVKKISPYLKNNFKKGVKQGYYKSDLEVDFALWTFFTLITSPFLSIFDCISLKESSITLFLNTILTDKGQQEFEVLRTTYFV